jgi:sugar/nucleoside kinase (ribokinase family)
MARQAPDVIVVGAAARDVASGDPRGWRLGGGVTYSGLALARLGLRTGIVIGLDAKARDAHELELLRSAGAEVCVVPIERGPVFHNEERPAGRVQTCLSGSDPVPPSTMPGAWRDAPAWLLAPVAAEVPDEWADVPAAPACVALGWQGMLRHLFAGERVWPIEPGPSPLLHRADLVGVSRHDLPHGLRLRDVSSWLGDRCELLLTAGPAGGLLLELARGRLVGGRRYAGIPPREDVDPTGAGDTMLAGLLAARIAVGGTATGVETPPGGGPLSGGRDLYIGALAASLLVERPGLDAVPWSSALLERRADASA